MEIGYLGALLGGVLSLLSPCSVMLLPAFFAYAFTDPGTLIARTGIFYLGLVTTLVPLGILAGAVGAFLVQFQGVLITVAAILVIALGLIQVLGIPLPSFGRRETKDAGSSVAVYVLGTAYGIAGVCTGPILGSVLTIAAVGANPLYGGILLAVYALGMALPLLVLALAWKGLAQRRLHWLRPRMLRIGGWRNSWHSVISGLFSLALGVFLLVSAGAGGFGSFLSTSTLFAVESWILELSARVPNLAVMLIALAVGGCAALIGLLRARGRARQRAAAGADDAPDE